MKPLKLVMQAFGPYPGNETVDFNELSKAGIFLIKGPTGSGKTTIFDAMSMALYGKSTGEEEKVRNGRNDLYTWRCNQADWSTETIVEFTFSVNDRIYRFKRRLVPKRKNLEPVYSACVLDGEGNFQPLSETMKESFLNDKAEELIGLNSSQFRQVVLLPQGKFERFLTADSAEKEQILGRLFDVEQWGIYAERLYNMAFEREKRLTDLRQTVMNSLQEENPEFSTVEQLGELLRGKRSRKDELSEAHTAFASEKKKEQLEAEKQLAGEFRTLHNLEKKKANLDLEENARREEEERLKRADAAEYLREPIREAERAEKEAAALEKQHKDAEERLPELAAAETKAAEEFKEYLENSPADAVSGEIAVLKSRRPLYTKLEELKENVKKAEKDREKAADAFATESSRYECAGKNAAEKLSEREQKETIAREYRERYYQGIYGELAEELEEDKPCPVCGSIHHPSPAVRTADSISKQMLEEAEAASDQARQLHEAAEKSRLEEEERLKRLEDAFKEAKSLEEETKAVLASQSGNFPEGIADVRELEERLLKLEQKLSSCNGEKERLEQIKSDSHDRLERFRTSLSELKARLDEASEERERRSAELLMKLPEGGYRDAASAKADLLSLEERNALQDRISTYRANRESCLTDLNSQRERLAGKTEPDSGTFSERQQEIDNEEKRYHRESAELETEISRLDKKYKQLSARMKDYNDNILQAESDLSFARTVHGNTGIGLQRYVLGIMFGQIISEANHMLELVHGGRYRLLRTDEKGSGNKKGLELKVRDSRKPEEERPVGSLSGGEKFLVSLSLSIGMSAVARKSGLHIEALFIDEGFGTLDDSSISDAMDILECVRKGNGMIGVISHVAALESTIPRHIEVVKTDRGSHIRIG